MDKIKPYVILKVIIGHDNSSNLEGKDMKYLKDRFDKEKIEMIVINERVDEYGVGRLTKEELEDFADSIIENKKSNEQKMKLQIDLELQNKTEYIN